MAKEKFKIKVEKPKVRKDWGPIKPYTKVHGSTKYDRDDEKSETENEIVSELDEKQEKKPKAKK
jgi:hypothetical protein